MARRPKIDAPWEWPGSVTLSGPIGAVVHVVGESHYQAALLRVAGGKTETGARRPRAIAELVREPRNRHDSNAVAVQIGGDTVGYIAREEAPRVGHVVEHMWSYGSLATVAASITGGWNRGYGNEGSFGVVLHCDVEPEVWNAEQHPGLPPETKVAMQGEEHAQDRLERLLVEGARVGWLAQGPRPWANSDDPAVLVKLDDQVVGALSPTMSQRYLPWLRGAAMSGATLSAWVGASNGKKKVEAEVWLPKVDA